MFRSFRFMLGIWIGAVATAFPFAAALLYLLTGKIAMPGFAGGGLVQPDELVVQIRDLAHKAMEQSNG